MKRLALGAVVDSARWLLAFSIAVLAFAGSSYLVGRQLNNPDHYKYGVCPWYGQALHGPLRSCRLPTRATWQIPLAVVILLGGLGTAVLVAGERPRRGAPAPDLGARPPA
jgi:hypothetical protein